MLRIRRGRVKGRRRAFRAICWLCAGLALCVIVGVAVALYARLRRVLVKDGVDC